MHTNTNGVNRKNMKQNLIIGAAMLTLLPILLSGCSNSDSADPVVKPTAAQMAPAATTTASGVDSAMPGKQPESLSQQLSDPNVPANVKAMIKSHLPGQ